MSQACLPEFFDYEITDVDAYASVVSKAQVEISQLLPGTLRGHHTRIRIAGGEISWVATNLPLRGRGRMPSGVWTLSVVTRATGRSLQHGAEVRPGSLVIHEPGAVHDGIYGRDFSIVCIGVPNQGFERCVDRLASAGHRRAGPGWSVAQAPTTVHPDLVEQFEGAGRTLRHDEAFRVSGAAVRSMIDDLTSSFMNALRDALPSRQEPALRDGADVVRRAEVALVRDGRYALRVDELCRATGVPRRSLSRAFELVLGVGPATYLRRYRLNEARRALLHDRHAGSTVTDVARRFGFHHLGRFSEEYRELFGELPSATCRPRAERSALDHRIA